MGRRIVAELLDVGVPVERGLDNPPLNSAPSPVDHANLAKTRTGGCLDVSLYNRWDIARREWMQIELILNRHAVRIVHGPPPCRTTR